MGANRVGANSAWGETGIIPENIFTKHGETDETD